MAGVYTDRMTDYQDWQSFPTTQSGNLFAAWQQTLPPGPTTTGVLPAVNWSSVSLMLSPSAGAAFTKINHCADPAGAQVVGADLWRVRPGTNLVVRTPLRGKYVRIDIHVTSPGNFTAITWATLMSAASDRITFPVAAQTLADTGKALAANGTAVYDIPAITAGLGYLYFKPADTTAKLSVLVHTIDELGNPLQPVADLGTPGALTQQLITVPDQIVEVKVTNTDPAAPHTYDFSLTVPPQ